MMTTSKMEKDVVRIKLEQPSPRNKPSSISLLDCGLTNDDFLNNLGHDVASLMSPLPCDKCGILAESNKKLESHVQTIMESLRMTQEENAGLKLQLKLSDIQVGEQAQEIEKLKKEIALAKEAKEKIQTLSVSPSSRSPGGGGGGANKRRRSASNTPPSRQCQQAHESALAQLQLMCPPQVPPRATVPWGSCHPPMGSYPPPSGSYPSTMANNHPTMTSNRPPMTGTHPPTASNHPPTVSNHPPMTNSHPSTVINHPPTVSNHPPTVSNHPPTVSNHPSMTNNHPPMTNNHPPIISSNRDRYIFHGIDSRKRDSGYFCICTEEFSIEALLYKHLKNIIMSRAVTMSPASSPTSPPSSPYQWNVVVCCICQETFVNWSVFRYHTQTIHGIKDLETFEWNELNMHRHIYQSNPNQSQNYSHGQPQQ